MNDTLNNQLAQICNNLYCLLRHVKYYHSSSLGLGVIHELETQYNKLFKLIYGDK